VYEGWRGLQKRLIFGGVGRADDSGGGGVRRSIRSQSSQDVMLMEKGSKATGWGEGLLGCGEGVEGGEGGSAAALRAEESPSSPGMKGNAMLRTCWQYKIQ